MSAPTVNFNGNDFAATVPYLRVIGTDPGRFPARDLNTNQIASVNKSVTASAYFKERKINVQVEIGAPDRATLESSIDTLEAFLQTREAPLIFVQSGANRKYTATLANVSITDTQGGWAALDLEFECADPYGYDPSTSPLSDTSRSGASSTESFVCGGTAEFQSPIITITLSALTGGTAKTITITTPATLQAIVVTRNWTAADVLVIDCQARTVKVNGTEVAFSGAFPEWAPGAGTVSYLDTLTTRIRNFNMVHYRRYL